MRKSSLTTGISLLMLILAGTASSVLAQEPRTGAISVEVQPAGIQAQVYLDGKKQEGDHRTIPGLPAGLHQLAVLAPGMEIHVQNVNVEPGMTTDIRVRLRPLSGSVSVSTDPPGAKVSIDGREIGTSPVEVEKVSCGKHAISASLPGFLTREKEITVEYGDELSVFLRMKKKETALSIFSFPSGAQVFIDGKNVGLTPLRLKNVAPGRHVLRLVKGEGCTHEETITVLPGRDLALDISLPVAGAILSLDPGPDGRNLYVDGHLFAKLESRRTSIPPGEHLLKITGWKGTLLCQRHLKLEKGKTYKLAIKPGFRFISTLKGHEQGLLALTFAPDGTLLASASKDGTVRLWDVETKKETMAIKAHPPGAQAVAFGPKGEKLASGGWDKFIRIWDISLGVKLKEIEVKSPVQAVAWSRDGHYVAAGCADGTLRVWDLQQDWKEIPLRGHEDGVRSITFSPEESTLISGGADGRVILWNIPECSRIENLSESSSVKGVSVSGNGRYLATGCEDGLLRIRKLNDLGSVWLMRAQPHWIMSLSPGWGSVYAAGGDAAGITILDAAGGKLLELKELKNPATALSFDSSGRYLAAGTSGGVIGLWLAE